MSYRLKILCDASFTRNSLFKFTFVDEIPQFGLFDDIELLFDELFGVKS